jgi:hypothetical protein
MELTFQWEEYFRGLSISILHREIDGECQGRELQFYYLFIVVLGVHCDIYKGSYNK